jgi:flagella basal body P-ring formation protein FlgA
MIAVVCQEGARVISKFFIFAVLFSAIATTAIVRADESTYSPQVVAQLKSSVTQELEKSCRQFNHPRISLGLIKLIGGKLPTQIQSIALLSENDRGEAQFNVLGADGATAQIIVNYAAWVPVRVANKRITPGERIFSEAFNTQEVNVATGMPYELRGVLLSNTEDVSRLESRQTILEGQYLVSNAVQKVPDVRRGDSVRILVISGDLNLTTIGTASEPGYSNSNIKVVTGPTHRELTGVLQPGGVVEVKL